MEILKNILTKEELKCEMYGVPCNKHKDMYIQPEMKCCGKPLKNNICQVKEWHGNSLGYFRHLKDNKLKEECLDCKDLPEGKVIKGHDHRMK